MEPDGPFPGYPQPTSNTTYTPNQFFDVTLRHGSRGVVRLVAHMIRKTLGWCDAHGNPQEPQVAISYSQLVNRAGISHGAIREAIEEAVAARYINCLRAGRRSAKDDDGVPALYELRWDEGDRYVTPPEEFDGFYAGNGNPTYIPNVFFDYTVKREPLAVVKVVGALIRDTIGYQTRYGFRRRQAALPFSTIQHRAGIKSTRHVAVALQYAIEHNRILRVEAGFFDSQAGRDSAPAVYALRWQDSPPGAHRETPDSSDASSTRRRRS